MHKIIQNKNLLMLNYFSLKYVLNQMFSQEFYKLCHEQKIVKSSLKKGFFIKFIYLIALLSIILRN